MAFVPDWISKADASRVLFLVLGALVAAFKDGFVWVGRLFTHWIHERSQSRKSVLIVQNWLQPGGGGHWFLVPMHGRQQMLFVGSFRVTNSTRSPVSFTRIDCKPSGGSAIFQVRAFVVSPNNGGLRDEIPPQSIDDVRLEFGLDPAPAWTGVRRLKLQLTDSAGIRRKVAATFVPAPVVPTQPGSSAGR
jgi:hypothetical protein